MDIDNDLKVVHLLMAYQSACQQFDVDAAIAFFTTDGSVQFAGETYAGATALRQAHLWDRGAQNQLALLDQNIAGNTVQCSFANQHELQLVLGVQAIHSPAEVSVHSGRIAALRIGAPDPRSLQAFRDKSGPFFAWVRAQQPGAWQRTTVLDETGGRTLFELTQAWQAAQAGG